MNSLVRLTDFDPNDDKCLVGDETSLIMSLSRDVWVEMWPLFDSTGLRVVRTDRSVMRIPIPVRFPSGYGGLSLSPSVHMPLVTLHPHPYRIDDWEIKYAFSKRVKTYVIQGTPRRLSNIATVGSQGH